VIALLSPELPSNAGDPQAGIPSRAAAGTSSDGAVAGSSSSADVAGSDACLSGQQDGPLLVRGVYDHLLSLLPYCTEIARELGPNITERGPGESAKAMLDEVPPMRLSPYFRVLTWCVRHGAEPTVPLVPLINLYDLQDGHHWDCDDTKLHLLQFWHAAALAQQPAVATSSALAIAAQPQTFSRLLDSFVSLRPQERNVQYNRELLPPFYGLLRVALSYERHSKDCMQVLAQHRNWIWAMRYVIVESHDYVNLLPLCMMTELPPVLHENAPLSPILLSMLRPCSRRQPFRQKALQELLEERVPVVAPNTLVLLEMFVDGEAEVRYACRKELLNRLVNPLLGRESVSLDVFRLLLLLMTRVIRWINGQDKQRPEVQQLKKQVLETQRAQILMGIVYDHLGSAVHLDPQVVEAGATGADGAAAIGPSAQAPAPPPAMTTSAAFELAIELTKFDIRCAFQTLQNFSQHVPSEGEEPQNVVKARCTELMTHFELLETTTGSDTRYQRELLAAICSWFPTESQAEPPASS